MLKQTIIALLVFILPLQSFAQNRSGKDVYANEWKKVDSLLEKDLPKSAQPIIQKVLDGAVAKNDIPNKIKAQVYLTQVRYGNEEHALKAQIKALEAFTEKSSGAEKAVWQSLTAGLYWKFYQQNRYRLYNRTQLAQTTSDDIDTWDAAALASRIATLYDASLEERALLQATPVAQYEPIVLKGINTTSLRPTLYDLLVFNAIKFFSNEESGITKAADAFQMEGNLWFEPAERFSEVRVKVKDGSDFKFKALKLYQDLLAFHLKDAKPDALIDADLQRLAFVHDKGVNPKKDSLYISALQNIVNKFPESPSVAQALFLIAQQQMGDQNAVPYYRGVPNKKTARNLPQVKAQLESIIKKYPGSEGAANARNLLNQIKMPSLSLQTELVNIPDENIKALLSYKNIPVVYLRLYKLPAMSAKKGYETDEAILSRVRNLSPFRTWQQTLPGIADLEQHSAEIKIDALPIGSYALAAGSKEEVGTGDQIVVFSEFKVSAISFVAQDGDDKKGYVLNRKTGYPLPGVKVFFFNDNYENSKPIRKLAGNNIADKDGIVQLPPNSSDYRKAVRSMLLVKDKDSLFMDGYISGHRNNNDDDTHTQTFFFTDRAIYRPGQTMYFKGIVVKSSEQNKKNEVVADRSTTVALYDANSQLQGKLELKTNEYGSFTGSFRLPEGLLNGSMSVRNEDGSQDFSVEEYKRPKFYVEFDTLKGSYALNEDVVVKGFARAYAGNNIDNASVKYRVVRKTRFPYYWCYYYWGMPQATETEIANATVATAADGSFEVPFKTMPDASIEPKSMPVFYYEVYADVTDINGETRSGNKQLISGYTSLQVVASIPETSKPKDLQQLDITTENLNGIFNAATVHVSIARLKFPGFLRKRIWSAPDQFTMSESEFHKAFPQDEYKDEGNYLNWATEKTLFEKTWVTAKDQKLEVPAATWYQNGWYVIEIKTKDAQGHEITEKKYTHVWAPGKKEPNQKDIVVYTDKESYQPGEKLTLWLGTAVDQPYLLSSSSVSYKPGNPVTIDIQEKDRGGMAFSWLYVYNNRIYTASEIIAVPWSNKELQIEWASHRDKLLPGAKEQWTMTIKGNKKEQVAAELLAGMYDASLDAFKPHAWTWQKLFPVVDESRTWNREWFNILQYSRQLLYSGTGVDVSFEKRYDYLIAVVPEANYGEVYYSIDGAASDIQTTARMGRTNAGNNAVKFAAPVVAKNEALSSNEQPKEEQAQSPGDIVQIRKNLQETAFFLPQLKTDAAGNVSFGFTMPEALTEWKLMAFAHTKDWKTGYLEGKIKTQKDVMVAPNMPRFLRQGDNIQISTKVVNLSDHAVSGHAKIEMLDAQTLEPVPLSQFMQLKWSADEQDAKPFTVAKGQSASVQWNLHVPESRYTPVVVRITAIAGAFSDGEDNTLPVVTNRTLVTETLPVFVKGNESKDYTLASLLNQNSATLLPKGLTVEFTGNPAWYAVQALPYLMEYPYECAEQTFNRFYANALAQHIVAQSPKVQRIFDEWQKDSTALISNLEKNEDLKTALLEETPWVMEAKDETAQKHRVGLLFQANRLAKESGKTLDKLGQMQLPDGSFPWFNGMRSDRFITQYILTGIGRLHHLQVRDRGEGSLQAIYTKALDYVDGLSDAAYKQLLQSKADLKLQHIDASQVQYLYMRSFYAYNAVKAANKTSFDYYKKQAAQFWPKFNANLKGQIALALYRMGDTKTALQILQSLKETAIQNDELGMYWKDMRGGYYWADAPIESQALLIEAFAEITKDKNAVEAMKLWLLKNKQTQNWSTTKATADACYALLLNGSDWLTNQPEVTIQLGNQKIESSREVKEAGTGYFRKYVEGKDLTRDMDHIKVSVQQPNADAASSWGAVYWQYFEDMDKVAGNDASIHLEKQLFVERNSATGPVLTPVTEGGQLQVGDKVKMRIVVKVDRDMEYVQLKDMRAACFEPVDVLSTYHYQNGTGYFQSTKDLATNFFFDHLPKGTYVFEYPVWVNAKGSFSNGISTIQCMYAPEFSSHTAGMRVEVK